MTLASAKRSADLQGKADAAGADYLARVREIAPALAAAAEEIDRRRELPEAIVDALIERGLFRLLLPRSLGGAELLPAQYVPIIEAIAQIDASTAWCINQNSGCSMTAAYARPGGRARDLRRTARHPRLGTGSGRGAGRARRLSGHRDLGLRQRQPSRELARLPCAGRSRRTASRGCAADGTPVVRTMLFPKSSTKFTDIWHTIGLRGTASNQYSVKDLFVPEAYSVDVLSRRDGAATREHGPALPFQQPVALRRPGLPGSRSALRAAMLGAVHRAGARQDPARRPQHDAQQQCDPVAGRASRGAAVTRRAAGCCTRSRTSPRRSQSAAISRSTSG